MNYINSIISYYKRPDSKISSLNDGKTNLLSKNGEGLESLLEEKPSYKTGSVLKKPWSGSRFFSSLTPKSVISSSISTRVVLPLKDPFIDKEEKVPLDSLASKIDVDFSGKSIVRDFSFTESDSAKVPEKAATKIQAVFRGGQVRQSFLPRELYPRYKALIENAGENFPWPRAKYGKTRVYFPEDVGEVVLKYTGRDKAVERFHQMQYVRGILVSQKCTHLVIPKVRLFGSYLIEERIPITSGTLNNINNYKENKDLFNEAIREMVRLYSKTYIRYLVNETLDEFGNPMVCQIRYDNISLIIDRSSSVPVGKIVLVDLERNKGDKPIKTNRKLDRLAQMFPEHRGLLIQEASSLGMKFDEEDIQYHATLGQEYMLRIISRENCEKH